MTELQYQIITPNTKRNNARSRPPKWAVGARLGYCVVEEYLGRKQVDMRPENRNKTAHCYLLRCDCGTEFEADQNRLFNSLQKRKTDYSCGCASQTSHSRIPEPVPCIHDWGYRVKPINPYLARSYK